MMPATWLEILGRASVEGGLLVGAVWFVARLGRRLPPAARALLWWAASARLLIAFLPLVTIGVPMSNPLPALGRTVAERISWQAESAGPRILPSAAGAEGDAGALLPHGPAGSASRPLALVRACGHVLRQLLGRVSSATARMPWPAASAAFAWALCAIWAAGVALRLWLWAREGVRVERAWREAHPIDEPAMAAWLEPWLGGAAARVEVREGDAFVTPLVLGGRAGRILLPSGFTSLPSADQRAALAHEAAHLRRHDLSMGVVVAFAECAFWFHPLAALAAHEYALAREEACDAEALRLSGAAPDRYGDLLLRLGLEPSPPTRAAASCGSRHVHQLRRRILMLAHASSRSRGRRAGAVALVLAAAVTLAPLRFIAPATAADRGRAYPDHSVAPHGRTTIVTPDHDAGDYNPVDERDFSFGRYENGSWFFWGSFDDRTPARIKRLEATAPSGELFWFRDHDDAYVVRDPGSLDHLGKLLEPMEDVSARQSHLGGRQGALGSRQGALGARQGELGQQEGLIDQQMEVIEQRIEDLSADRKPTEEAERQRDQLREHLQTIERRQHELDREQDELGAIQDSLGRMQDELGDHAEQIMNLLVVQVRDYVRPLIENGKAQRSR